MERPKPFTIEDTYEESAILLKDVIAHPLDGIPLRYKRTGLSNSKGNRLRQFLVSENVVTTAQMKFGRTFRVVLSPTSTAQEWLDMLPERLQKERQSHEYFKKRYASHLSKLGFDVNVESNRDADVTGRCDVLAEKAGKKVAIEVETGHSAVISNLIRNVLAGVSLIVVVATDIQAFNKINRKFVRERLSEEKRIRLVLQDDFASLDFDL